MSHITTVARNTFNKVFKNLAKELNTIVENIQLSIQYKEGKQIFVVYKNFKAEKEITLGDWCGAVIDWSGGSVIIESTIAQGGAKYAKEFNTPIDNIQVIMQYNNGELPMAVLMNANQKVRKIDIETEFLK